MYDSRSMCLIQSGQNIHQPFNYLFFGDSTKIIDIIFHVVPIDIFHHDLIGTLYIIMDQIQNLADRRMPQLHAQLGLPDKLILEKFIFLIGRLQNFDSHFLA
ncbi:MAG: hypothetical protein UZ08_BCD001002253 [Candidatus Parvibacillus calidus]|nr:MAG: hypothetical protein UZ08_BCD001002253 [Candidatus Parvibacillus calidus]